MMACGSSRGGINEPWHSRPLRAAQSRVGGADDGSDHDQQVGHGHGQGGEGVNRDMALRAGGGARWAGWRRCAAMIVGDRRDAGTWRTTGGSSGTMRRLTAARRSTPRPDAGSTAGRTGAESVGRGGTPRRGGRHPTRGVAGTRVGYRMAGIRSARSVGPTFTSPVAIRSSIQTRSRPRLAAAWPPGHRAGPRPPRPRGGSRSSRPR